MPFAAYKFFKLSNLFIHLGRIYIPFEDLNKFNIDENDILNLICRIS